MLTMTAVQETTAAPLCFAPEAPMMFVAEEEEEEEEEQQQKEKKNNCARTTIRYEDQHVKLTGTELMLKTYYNNDNGQNSVNILLSQIVHVCWSGIEEEKEKTHFFKKKKKDKKKKKQKQTGKKIGVNNGEGKEDDDEEGKKHIIKCSKASKRFVIVASINGTQQTTGYGFSVLDDPLMFHKLIQPDLYVEKEKEVEELPTSTNTGRESMVAMASSASKFIKRNLSKDNLLSLAGGGAGGTSGIPQRASSSGAQRRRSSLMTATSNKNDHKIMTSNTLGSAMSTGELQSLLAGFHVEEDDDEVTDATADESASFSCSQSQPLASITEQEQPQYTEINLTEQHDDRPFPPRD